MEQQVETNSIAVDESMPGMVADDSQPVVDEVNVSELVTPTTESNTVEQTADVADSQSAPPDDGAKLLTQDEVNKIIGARLSHVRQQYEKGEAYSLGKMLLDERAKRENISAQEAYKRIQQERIKSQAEMYAKEPTKFYQDYLTEKQSSKEATPQDEAYRFGQELAAANEEGLLPEGFDVKSINQAFYDDMRQNGVKVALENWAKNNSTRSDVSAELRRRQSSPRPMSPTAGNISTPDVNFMDLSSEEFKKIEQAVKRAQLGGKTVRFS